ncbi:helix-turn-helix domain-containing protein [Candidatus Nomurabacteria bacterium]|nr:helix-turn-helix domain-containing protein [Candidatus Nomurabacteria bacterium]
MDIYHELQSIGLHKSEIRVYLFLLENGLSTPPQVAKGTKIARTNCYNILESLEGKGLIETQKIGKRKAYLASDPEALLQNLETKKQSLQKVLPDLKALHVTQKNKPKITFYEGFDQVKNIYWQTLSAEEIFAIGSTKHLDELHGKFFKQFLSELKHKGIVLYDILTPESGKTIAHNTREALKGLYDVDILPEKYKEISTDILIWDNNVALVALEEPIFGTVLTNPPLARTFKLLVKLLKEQLKK